MDSDEDRERCKANEDYGYGAIEPPKGCEKDVLMKMCSGKRIDLRSVVDVFDNGVTEYPILVYPGMSIELGAMS